MRPYTYFLIFTNPETNEQLFYYGVEYKSTAQPSNFWKTYFTSSDHIAALRKQYDDSCFKYEIRKVFNCPVKAQEWEQKVIRRMDAVYKEDWLNYHCFPIFIITDKIRQAISAKNKGHKYHVGRKHSVESKKNMSLAKQGVNHPLYGKNHTTDTKKKMSQTRLQNPPRVGPHSENTKRKMSVSKALTWLVTFPDGHSEYITNLKQFGREHNVSDSHMRNKGKSKGFTLTRI